MWAADKCEPFLLLIRPVLEETKSGSHELLFDLNGVDGHYFVMTLTLMEIVDIGLSNESLRLLSYYEQEKHLIKNVFSAAIHQLRAPAAALDKDLHRSFHTIGINSGSAQHEIFEYFNLEKEFFQKYQILPNWDFMEEFLERMAFKYKGALEASLIKRGILGKLGYDGLKKEEPSNEEQSTQRKKLSPRPRKLQKSRGNGFLQTRTTRSKGRRNNVQAGTSALSNLGEQRGDQRPSSGTATADPNPGRKNRKTRLLTEVS